MSAPITDKSQKMSLGQFVWMGFNYTVGIGFISNLAILSNLYTDDGSRNPDSIGVHILWLFVLIGLIAGLCAWAFAKMARVHNSNINGAAYIYTRSAFGKFWGFISVFMQYILLPFLICVQVFNLMKGFFSEEFNGGQVATAHWGDFTDLYLDLIAILVYMAFAAVILLGIKWYRRIASTTGYIKWVTSALLVIAGIVLACQNGSENYAYWFTSDGGSDPLVENGLNAFIKSFNSCFFFFAGFETFATAGKNLYQPEKNTGKGIILIILISTTLYVVVTFIFLGALGLGVAGGREFTQNENIAFWDRFTDYQWIFYGGQVVMIISQFALKANVSMQNALYGGAMIQPLAFEGYIPSKFKDLNKDNIPVKGSILNFFITGLMLMLWLVIPDIVQGISGTSSPFTVSSLTEASSAITLFIYSMVIASMLWLGSQKKVKVYIWEWIVFPIILVFLAFMFVYHYYNLFDVMIGAATDSAGMSPGKWVIDTELYNQASSNLSSFTGSLVELLFIIVAFSSGVILYFAYYKSKVLKQRLSTDEGRKLQEKLDSDFIVLSLSEVMANMKNEINEDYNYMKNLIENKYQKSESKIDKELSQIREKFESDADYNQSQVVIKLLDRKNEIKKRCQLKLDSLQQKTNAKLGNVEKKASMVATDWK